MALSGVEVDSECMKVFDKMKIKKIGNKDRPKMAFFRINKDNTKIEFIEEEKSDPPHSRSPDDNEAMFELMKGRLIDAEPRYILFDFICKTTAGGSVEKLAFVSWCSDNAPVKKKMLFAASKEYLKKKFDGVQIVMEASEKTELSYEELKKLAVGATK
ncbi:hypothetical protein QZH41_009676 [Actinostola sp. cb2023]|nr:hypothetical protein QZH41_009676 [Actinostola sp. cb2023]